MDVGLLKEYIIENNCLEGLLHELQCGHIKYHSSGYYTCSNPDGDNKQAIVVYPDTLSCTNYTRQITKNKQADIIDLVCYIKDCNFPDALKWLCSELGIDYYYDFTEDIPESLLLTDMIFGMSESVEDNKDRPLKPISPNILNYYKPYVNDLFYEDNISYEVQQEFNIGYDECTNRITIPIYSEIGDLVGVKGRLFKKKEEMTEDDIKYLYIEPCSRARVLFGLNKSIEYIKAAGKVYVVEAEKSVMQGFSYGTCNIVGTGGKELSTTQIEMLIRLGVDIVFAFDKDVTKEDIAHLSERFGQVPIKFIFDENNILNDKESPTDDPQKWEILKRDYVYDI